MSKIKLPEGKSINCMLQSRAEVDGYTNEISKYGLISHPFSCKNFDIMKIVPRLTDGNILDMGSSGGSCILENAIKIGIFDRKIGIDLEYESNTIKPDGIELIKGDLMNTPFEDGLFKTICCLSVLEHQVDYGKLAVECSRLLQVGGELFITCDYFNPKVDTSDVGTKLYGLKWNILDMADVNKLIEALSINGLKITSEMDWTTNEKVINPQFFAPYGKSYTFCAMQFIKI